MYICENCGCEHDGTYGSGRFCSTKCSRGFSTKTKRKDINEKVSKSLTGKQSPFIGIEKIEREIRVCEICGTEFRCMTKDKRRFCSLNCLKEYTRLCRTAFENYREKCVFKFNVYNYPNHFNLSLIDEYGWYAASNRGNNLNGISRDHLYSVKDGFENNVDPYLISHPANCDLKPHTENQKKYKNSSITIEELKRRVELFNN